MATTGTTSPPATPTPAPAPAPAASAAPGTTAATTPVSAPSTAQPIIVPWGHWLQQTADALEPFLAQAASEGETLLLGNIPIVGPFIEGVVGPAVVSDYVSQGVKYLDGVIESLSTSVTSSNAIETFVLNSINTEVPAMLTYFSSSSLITMIQAEIAKLTAGSSSSTTAASTAKT
jgi:hypothetical protein